MNVNIMQTTNCMGCFACKCVCPSNAIEEYNEEGEVCLHIDRLKCIECGQCASVCPQLNQPFQQKAYAVQMPDYIRKMSSSGGMFYALASWVIRMGGYVCGAEFREGIVQHTLINDLKKIKSLQTSKYIESNVSVAYKDIKLRLDENKTVLFSGTPCQCAAVKALFDSENLILVDILCMGVPSQKMWLRYMKEEFPDVLIYDVNFRDKNLGWSQDLFLLLSTSKGKFEIAAKDSSYYWSFLKGLSIKETCTKCAYTNLNRVGDISIGDFWAAASFSLRLDDRKGTSLCLVNTFKGNEIFEAMRHEISCVVPIPMDIAHKNSALIGPTRNKNRKVFWEALKTHTIADSLSIALEDKDDIGIINYWYTNDHGAILTAYALQTLLRDMGYSSRLINICPQNYMNLRKGGISECFEEDHLLTTTGIYNHPCANRKLNDLFDTFMVGSDQVFRAEWVGNEWFLDFTDASKKRISISASFGTGELNVDKKRKVQIKYLLDRFDHLSVRENEGIKICKNLGVSSKVKHILDPVFLVDKFHYLELIQGVREQGKYTFVYVRDMDEKKKKEVSSFCKCNSLQCVYVKDNMPIEEFITNVNGCEYFITDSYHGLCFAIIFNKKYACYVNQKRGGAKVLLYNQSVGVEPLPFY